MTVSGTSVLAWTRCGRCQASHREIPGGSVERMISSNHREARVFDGLHRIRVAHGAVSCGADLAKTVQFGVKVGLGLNNALLARSDAGRAGQ
jgi:hypothetical protein